MEVLAEIGWMPAPEAVLTDEPALKFNFGNLELVATTITNLYLQHVVSIGGLYRDGRTLAQILFEVPERIESRAQVLAWMAYGIDARIPLAITPGWLDEGRQAQGLLPWEQERAAYSQRPQATVARDWMRVLGKQLLAEALDSCDADSCRVHFDGNALRFQLPGKTMLVQATGGKAWPVNVIVGLTALRHLPRRWMQDPVGISYWDGRLCVGNRLYDATTESVPPAPDAPSGK